MQACCRKWRRPAGSKKLRRFMAQAFIATKRRPSRESFGEETREPQSNNPQAADFP